MYQPPGLHLTKNNFMKILFTAILFVCFSITATAQSDAGKLIEEGIALHDKGDYSGAIEKYDEALRLDPENYLAMYEKSYAFMAMKKYKDAEVILEKVLQSCKDPEVRKLCFVNYGTIHDYTGNTKKSLKVYDDGIREFPDYYLLHFNKGITYSGMKANDDALQCFQQSLRCNPYHASSHNAAGRLVSAGNRIPAIMAIFSFLIIEPTGKRAEQNLEFMNGLIMKGISRTDEKNVTISIDPAMLGDKKKKKEDDFGPAELMMSLLAASNEIPDSLGAKTEADRLSYRLQMLVNVIGETSAGDKGFFRNFYVPFFREMKTKGLLTTACYIALASTDDEDIQNWLEDNEDKLDEFYEWFKKYTWPNG